MTGSLLDKMIGYANRISEWLPHLAIRLLLAWEFGESGWEKFKGENWFADIQGKFPFPFDLVPANIGWFFATWSELLGAVALVIGLFTRFFSVSLFILTVLAWASVHAGNGYNVCDNGFKLPLMYLVLLLPLIFQGPGKLSLDHVLWKRMHRR